GTGCQEEQSHRNHLSLLGTDSRLDDSSDTPPATAWRVYLVSTDLHGPERPRGAVACLLRHGSRVVRGGVDQCCDKGISSDLRPRNRLGPSTRGTVHRMGEEEG